MLTDDYASTRHARLFPQNGQWIVEDLGSTNGTYLDRQKVTQPTPVPVGRADPHRQDRSGTAQMTLALRYAVRSDVGLLREGNEDSAYAGPRLLAIADGMGGHAAGEVASAVAIAALAALDDGPARAATAATRSPTRWPGPTSNCTTWSRADPSIEGMGTTLTAMLWSGHQVALCHIGDSRAYLLRDGELHQITHDHTLVQSLVDEGRISPDEAATHPQRSLLLRALDGSSDAEPDLAMREAQVGDRYLLCSDGLSDVVSEQTLHRTLATVADPDEAVAPADRPGDPRRRPGQHHLHRRRRGGQRDRAPAAQRGVGAGRRRLQRQTAGMRMRSETTAGAHRAHPDRSAGRHRDRPRRPGAARRRRAAPWWTRPSPRLTPGGAGRS